MGNALWALPVLGLFVLAALGWVASQERTR